MPKGETQDEVEHFTGYRLQQFVRNGNDSYM